MTFEEEDVELGLPDGPLETHEEMDPFVTKIGGKPVCLHMRRVYFVDLAAAFPRN